MVNKFLIPCLCIYLFTEEIRPYRLIVNSAENNILLGVIFFISYIIISLLLGLLITRIASALSNKIEVSRQMIVDKKLNSNK